MGESIVILDDCGMRSRAIRKPFYWRRSLQELLLCTLSDGEMSLWELSSSTGRPEKKVAYALGHLISQGHVVPIRRGPSLKFQKIPGSLFNWILDHGV